MWLPSGLEEYAVITTMDFVISGIIKDVTPFSIYRGEELRQQAFMYGIEAMNTQKYDNKRPLAGFLRTCIINRIISLSRDKYSRNEPPCKNCPFRDDNLQRSESGCKEFDNKMKCDKYKAYYKRNEAKRNIMNLQSATPFFDVVKEPLDLAHIDNRDYVEWLLERLTSSAKEILLEIMRDRTVPEAQLNKLRLEVSEIIEGQNK